MVRIELAADDSLAEIRARSRFGIAIAAMIRMIATTMSNSISEKPFCFRMCVPFFSVIRCGLSRPNCRLCSHFSGQKQKLLYGRFGFLGGVCFQGLSNLP